MEKKRLRNGLKCILRDIDLKKNLDFDLKKRP